ncbi:MAG: hypothetical protein ACK4NY_10575 [Spirosomataceae bacterium]
MFTFTAIESHIGNVNFMFLIQILLVLSLIAIGVYELLYLSRWRKNDYGDYRRNTYK